MVSIRISIYVGNRSTRSPSKVFKFSKLFWERKIKNTEMDEAEILESGGGQDRDLWLDRDPADFGVDDSSIFYSDNFPSLPDFPCISSSSSSLSSSSSSMTWNTAMEIPPLFDPQIDVDCSNVMQELRDMDLLDTNNMWEEQQEQKQRQEEGPQDEGSSEDLGTVFLEWLKSNKESISAEDLRSITLKKSTVECAARRLGGGKEGMTQLLKLILQWVQNHHLHKRRMRAGGVLDVSGSPSPNPNPTLVSPDSHLCFSPSMPWIPHQTPFYADPTAGFPPMLAYMGDPAFAYGFPMIDTRATWSPPHFSLYNSYRDQQLTTAPPPPPPPFGSGSCGNHYLCGTQMLQERGERVRKIGSLATKEARKKRMARQKRFLSHHQRQHATLASDANCTTSSQLAKPGGNCVFWPSTASVAVMPSDVVSPSSDRPPLQPHHQRQFTSERHQEKNLRFLLQKVLKQSDVGTLGRIVLPKKEAEMHLPELESRDGISILVEDIGTSRIWNMRYRFWPNNKSRIYLLENTGDFVRSNGLQEGDFIVIYSDLKRGKYMIRGVKVRHPGSKMEAKRAGKPQRNLHAIGFSAAADVAPLHTKQ